MIFILKNYIHISQYYAILKNYSVIIEISYIKLNHSILDGNVSHCL